MGNFMKVYKYLDSRTMYYFLNTEFK